MAAGADPGQDLGSLTTSLQHGEGPYKAEKGEHFEAGITGAEEAQVEGRVGKMDEEGLEEEGSKHACHCCAFFFLCCCIVVSPFLVYLWFWNPWFWLHHWQKATLS